MGILHARVVPHATLDTNGEDLLGTAVKALDF